MRMSPDTEQLGGCSTSGCRCLSFRPGGVNVRSCDQCGHGWVSHALQKLQQTPLSPCGRGPVEVALPGPVLDVSSLVLYGAQAVPVRLKILLDRLYSVLTPQQVGHILHTLGWSLGDYVRGYMLQVPGGSVLDSWSMVTPEEEGLVLSQFLRFGETRPIVELMCLTAVNHPAELSPAPKSCRTSRTFVDRIRAESGSLTDACCFRRKTSEEHEETVRHFENFPLVLPVQIPDQVQTQDLSFTGLTPNTQDLAPPTKPTLRKPSWPKLSERHRQEKGGGRRNNDLVSSQTRSETTMKIKADPDRPAQTQTQTQTRSTWNQISSSSLAPPSSSSSLMKISHKLHTSPSSSSSFSLNPLPSFSSSFLCPHPASSSSSLCSLPLPPTAGGRKGRVSCGVCGKSFYDKGTLKIHYNAVHLKIKHRCTVTGCTMVFSSLRSRNRHSANPNPRLHTGTGRTSHLDLQPHQDKHRDSCRDKDFGDAWWQRDRQGPASGPGHRDRTPPPLRTPSQDRTCRPDPPPPPSSLVPAAVEKPEPGPVPDLVPHGESCTDPVPKKKPRKSYRPVKIEREKMEGRGGDEEEEEEE